MSELYAVPDPRPLRLITDPRVDTHPLKDMILWELVREHLSNEKADAWYPEGAPPKDAA